jgi:uncharacterized protein
VIRDAPDGAILTVKVIPRAGKTAITGTRDNALLIRLAAAPVDGAANATLLSLLADALGVPKRQVTILSGEKSRTKHVKVMGVTAEVVRQRLSVFE